MNAQSYRLWIPTIVRDADAGPVADWYLGGRARFDGENFAAIVQRSMLRPFNYLFARETPLDMIEEIADASPSLPLAGILAHESRCGSTLVARMLAAGGRTRVVSEAGPIDALFRIGTRGDADDDLTIRRLRAMVRILARPGNEREERCVLKLDAWQTASLPLFERAFPDAPWVFIYRDPIEVMVSHAREPSYLMSVANAPAALGIPVTEAIRIPWAEYAARVLAGFCDAAIRNGADASRLVEYSELPDAVSTRIAPRFGLPVDDATLTAMRGAAEMHAKRPGEAFVADGEDKRASADAETLAATTRYLTAPYERLRALRFG